MGGSGERIPTATKIDGGDGRRITVEGFRTLSVLATFFAGLQAQMLSMTSPDNSTISAKFINAFWLAGIFLDITGAVLATITSRWFELLDHEHTETISRTWNEDEATLRRNKSPWTLYVSVDFFVATALFSPFPIVACGVALFSVGLLIYVWTQQPLLVSLISSIPLFICSPLIAVCFYPHQSRKHSIIEILAGKRGAW